MDMKKQPKKNTKGIKCKNCGAINMNYWVDRYKECGKCGSKMK